MCPDSSHLESDTNKGNDLFVGIGDSLQLNRESLTSRCFSTACAVHREVQIGGVY